MNAWEMPQVQALGEERLRLMQEAVMYSRKKIPAPFGKPQKTAEKKKEATTAFSQKETSKEPIFLHAEEKTMPQGGGSPVLAMLLLELLSAKKE